MQLTIFIHTKLSIQPRIFISKGLYRKLFQSLTSAISTLPQGVMGNFLRY